ncbi:MAG TPA: glycosyltransferase family 2 protein [Pirellulales bacterium]|nr:glycosyltransferase family 2 protein [Pirellulales bacterium]
MYQNLRVIVIAPAYNESAKIGLAVSRVPKTIADEVLVIDDGSADNTATTAQAAGAKVISLGYLHGVGYALRTALSYARANKFDVAVIMAGNNKDEPREIPRLLDPIAADEADLVIGSRYLEGGSYGGDMPLYRKLATRLHPRLLSFTCRKELTESTNGFRAIRLSCLDDSRINLNQKWLDTYGLEIYLLYKMIALGYRHREVPCTKIYPPRRVGNTKMKPVVGWWDMLRPVVFLSLGLKS